MTLRNPLTVLILASALALGGCATEGGGTGSGAGAGGLAAGPAITGSSLTGRSVSNTRDLVGKSDSQVQSALGTPAFKRTDGPAQVWQYRGSACLLDVFLYKQGTGFSVKHAELRRRGGGTLTDQACMANALTNRAKG